jgi:hypothetical protein
MEAKAKHSTTAKRRNAPQESSLARLGNGILQNWVIPGAAQREAVRRRTGIGREIGPKSSPRRVRPERGVPPFGNLSAAGASKL